MQLVVNPTTIRSSPWQHLYNKKKIELYVYKLVGGTHFWNSLHQVHSKIGHQIIKKKIGSKKTKGPKHDTLNCLRFTYPLGRSILCKHFIKLLLMGQTYCFHTVCSVLPSQEFVIPFTIYIELSQTLQVCLLPYEDSLVIMADWLDHFGSSYCPFSLENIWSKSSCTINSSYILNGNSPTI